MKSNRNFYRLISVIQISMFILLSNSVMAQVDTTITGVKTDSIDAAKTDTVPTAKNKKVKKDKFMIYGGGNLNYIDVTTNQFKSDPGLGYHLGIAYKRGNFFYWQVGARYNSAAFNFLKTTTGADTSKLTVNAFDVPLTAGINFLSFADRLVAVRAFISAVPSFTVGVGDNNLNLTKEDVNSFIFYGQAGIGVDIAFFMIETGFNYGFQDLLKNYSGSNPGQFFVSLGFRF
jgi:hypothetical protein